jgi:putative ABC transport system substrate-binding protein
MTKQRRSFLTLLASAAAAWPLAARAQQRAVPTVGFLSAGAAEGATDWMRSFRQGLKEGGGYIEPQNVAIEYRAGARASPIGSASSQPTSCAGAST